jgi:peptidoglycan-associated lipoprotein
VAPTPVATTEVTSAVIPRQVQVSPSVSVSDDIRRQCNLPLSNIADAPKFAFDESDLDLGDYQMLQLIGQCMSSGPLAGKSLELTGRADSIGAGEYNLALGARRSSTVASYLQKFGADPTHLQQTSRGDLDASGTDPAARQLDRRVDITLVK